MQTVMELVHGIDRVCPMNVLLYACHGSIKEYNCKYSIQGYDGIGGINP